MRKLNVRHGLAFALILVGASCAQKKNPKNEAGLPGVTITSEQRARYQAAQTSRPDHEFAQSSRLNESRKANGLTAE